MADPALGNTVRPATSPPWLPRKALMEVAKGNPKAADAARALSKAARKFERLDGEFRIGTTYSWTVAYEELLDLAEHVRYLLKRPRTGYERDLLAWSKQVSPSKGEIASRPWEPIEGLSPHLAWLQVLFEAALFRAARAWLPFSWVTFNGYQNPLCEHQKIYLALHDADWRLQQLTYHMIWRAIPWNEADRLLIRRAHQTRRLGIKVFRLKYRRAVRKWERAQGLYLPERSIRKPERLRMIWLNYDTGNPLMKFPISERSLNKLVLRYLPND